jgi:mannose/fructose/N-acetylgalactosamine-specific phosphotransferase system component IIB
VNARADPPFPYPAADTHLVGCNNCSNDNSWAATAKAQFATNKGGVVYEIDFINKAFKKECVTVKTVRVGNTTTHVHVVTEVTQLNEKEIKAFKALLQLADEMRSYTASLKTIQ